MKLILFTVAMLVSQFSYAGPFSDQLSRCLVKSTSSSDKELLIKWIYAAMSAHPKVQHMSKVSVAEGAKLNKETGELFMELITKRCKKETAESLKYEGPEVFKTSFAILGQVAMKGIMNDKNVASYIAGLGEGLDSKELEEAFKEYDK